MGFEVLILKTEKRRQETKYILLQIQLKPLQALSGTRNAIWYIYIFFLYNTSSILTNLTHEPVESILKILSRGPTYKLVVVKYFKAVVLKSKRFIFWYFFFTFFFSFFHFFFRNVWSFRKQITYFTVENWITSRSRTTPGRSASQKINQRLSPRMT